MKKLIGGIFIAATLVPSFALGDPSSQPVKKRLYLTSAAIQVMDTLVTLLPFEPDGHTACYVTTAGKGTEWMDREIEAVAAQGFLVKPVDLALLSRDSVSGAFANCDIIFVGGGNTFYLLQEVRRSGFDELVKKKIAEGIPYVGTSAGSILLAPNIECVKFADDPKAAPDLKSFDGLNMVPFVPFAHFDNPDLKEIYREIVLFALQNDIASITLKEKQILLVECDAWRLLDAP